jgi:hypothetical protein
VKTFRWLLICLWLATLLDMADQVMAGDAVHFAVSAVLVFMASIAVMVSLED